MEKTKNIVLAGVVVAILVLGFAVLKSPNLPTAKYVANEISSKLGALVGPDIPYPYLRVGGLKKVYQAGTLRTATSTMCVSEKVVSTSTAKVAYQITTGTSTAVYVMIEDTTIPYAPPIAAATSTLRGDPILVAANTQGLYLVTASTTTSTLGDKLDRNGVVSPNEYVVIHAKNAGGGTISQGGKGNLFGGTCQFEFTEL